ncbi:hypothetical protein [Segatella salivae]|jgi:hypothetical protein|uniref:hypothetical protein n=1 Tax=Segatella salivae TaxID=228604 RepID=UPI001CB4B68F|nr:hypothetical protein [Segatella salivae]MBF1560670.1 hypothetical protein [Segatella salivae]
MDFKSQTPNSEFLTEDQEKLFWAQRAIEKFKEYDKKRTAYVHQLEHDYQALRKSYDELENDMFGDAQDMTKAEQRRRKKIQAYDKIMSGYSALQFMQKRYMVDGEYTEEFQEFMRNYDAASMKERIKSLVEENKKLKSDNRELICKLGQCREQIAKLELAQHNQKGTEE